MLYPADAFREVRVTRRGVLLALLLTAAPLLAQSPGIPSLSADLLAGQSPLTSAVPRADAYEKPNAINLATALYLASPASSYVSGAIVRCDGGLR